MPESHAVLPRITAYPTLETTGSGPPSWDDNFPPALTEERKRVLLAYWRGVFSGEVEPEVMPIPPAVEEVVRREFPGTRSEAFWRDARVEYAMRWFYGGSYVTYWDSPRGCVILAIGNDELICLIESASPEQRRRMAKTTYPPSWEVVCE